MFRRRKICPYEISISGVAGSEQDRGPASGTISAVCAQLSSRAQFTLTFTPIISSVPLLLPRFRMARELLTRLIQDMGRRPYPGCG